ncbi:MAG TPA: DUF6263 family protein [Chitinophagales bacterium]|nr:hypothetical protein [Chitinophagales bacterium]HMX03465.1 DUF6263 family protein [Chitinophagales bacterium]HMZ89555.1 DUF6263 family protein [Chitinophagales bacterium]HNA57403.1 DUF6263 family protein [Chitinophagales bacterium]HNE45358.1 DUF6263 family protein [Chitinophagales bacterium]
MIKLRIAVVAGLMIAALFSTSCNKSSSGDKDNQSADTIVAASNDTAIAINLESPVADERVLLRFMPEEGKTIYIENNTTFASDESVDTMRIKANSTKYVKAKLVVKGKEKEGYAIDLTLVDVHKTVKDDSGTINYQYNKPMTNPEDEMDRKVEDCMVNSTLTLIMTEQGENIDVRGYEAIIKKVKAIVGAQVPDQYIAANIGSPTDNLEYFFISYPDSAVKIGDTWDVEVPSVMQGVPITLKTVFALADRRDGIAYINFNTVASVDKSKLPPEMAAEVDKIHFNAGVKGTGEIFENTGWPRLMKFTQYLDVSDSYQGHATSSKQTGVSTIRIVQQ